MHSRECHDLFRSFDSSALSKERKGRKFVERGRDFPALNQKHQTARCDITLNSPSFDAIPKMDGFNALTIRNKQNSLRPEFYRDASRLCRDVSTYFFGARKIFRIQLRLSLKHTSARNEIFNEGLTCSSRLSVEFNIKLAKLQMALFHFTGNGIKRSHAQALKAHAGNS